MDETSRYNPNDKEQLRAWAQALLEQVHETQDEVRELSRSAYARLLGDHFEKLLASRDATVARFEDCDPKIRQGAFSLMAHHWGPDSASEDLYKRTAFSDQSANVRAAALGCLIELYRRKPDGEFSKLLAKVVKDSESSPVVRSTAYLGLLNRQGANASNALKFALLRWKDQAAVPKEIDWSLVDDVLGE